MSDLYTKNGRHLRLVGDDVFDDRGTHVGRRRSDRIFGPDGRYAASIVGDRAVYRSTDAGASSQGFTPSSRAASGRAPHAPAALAGDEPFT